MRRYLSIPLPIRIGLLCTIGFALVLLAAPLRAVPLAPQVQAIVKQLMAMGGCDLVLESPEKPGHPLSENTLLFALYRLGYKGRQTVHGFRALASTVLNEQSVFAHDVIERQLAHKETDAVRAAYNRAEYLQQRIEMMRWYANWLDAQRQAARG